MLEKFPSAFSVRLPVDDTLLYGVGSSGLYGDESDIKFS
jgi:hypothetical protein